MSQYDKNTFESLYNDGSTGKPFQTNTSRAITEAIMRQFAKDASDSFVYGLNAPNVDVYSFESGDWAGVQLPGHGWTYQANGAGVSNFQSTYGQNSTMHAIGVVGINSGTSSTGGSCLYRLTNSIPIGIGVPLRLRMRCSLEVLSNGTDRYMASFGYGTNVLGGDQTNGIYFRYADNVNSGKWQAVTRLASVETAVDTGVAANIQYSIFDISINSAGTVATFQINSSTPITISTNIPTLCGIFLKIDKLLGTTSMNLDIDWYSHLISSTTAR